MYVCMYVYTDDVQLLYGTFLIYDQCTYSPANRYTNIFHWTPTKYSNEQDLSICMYVCVESLEVKGRGSLPSKVARGHNILHWNSE